MKCSLITVALVFAVWSSPQNPVWSQENKPKLSPIPDKLVVLSFDDANKSDRLFVADILKKYKFGATFYVTEGLGFLKNKKHYTTWKEIRELHDMGFEIGNHTQHHRGVASISAEQLKTSVKHIEQRCAEHGIPKPTTFCYPGFGHTLEAVTALDEVGFRFARRGVRPEYQDGGEGSRGPAYDPRVDHPLLIPSTGYDGPDWKMEDLKWAVDQARDGKIAVLCFHGVPALEHPWVNTDPEDFKEYMRYLKDEGCTVIAMRDLAKYVDPKVRPKDPYKAIAARSTALRSKQWNTYSVRDELMPEFSRTNASDGSQILTISGGNRQAIDGAWVSTVPLTGGTYYRFSASRVTEDVASPRRSAFAKITWQDEQGRMVKERDDRARPEYPRDQASDGNTILEDTFLVPKQATQARIELRLRWTGGTVHWSDITLREVDRPKPRTARLATVHFRPRNGKTSDEQCRGFAPFIAQAGKQHADLVCLPESLTYCGTGRSLPECAEPIPGPSTEYFGKLAKQHDLYIVAGLTEREGTVVYNTAALLGPDGNLHGKYRKVCLPREEIEAGVTPGEEYPVFKTRFGKLGMMICWDLQFPEVARNLSTNGAEVIAMPIWGGNPTLASARAIENQIFLVSSTYTEASSNEMVSGVWDRRGKLILRNDADWGKVLVTEVNLGERLYWNWLGDLKARIPRERPASGFEQ